MKRTLALCLAAALVIPGCVAVDDSLGSSLVDKSLLFDTYTIEFPLTEITMQPSEDLSGYSESHLTIGAIRDDDFGLTTRSAAFPLIPALDTLDLGKDPEAVGMMIYFAADTISCAQEGQERIMQNIYVTELTEPLINDVQNRKTTRDIKHGSRLITDGLPVYNGSGPLQFSFTKAYAQKYVDAIKTLAPDGVIVNRQWESDVLVQRFKDYVAAVPGIYIETEKPEGNGGRINLFDFSCLSVASSYYYRNNNVALLKVNSEWDGARKDSLFMFIPGEAEFVNESDYLTNNTKFYQYSFNRTTHSTTAGKPTTQLMVEGGGGLKPVIKASELRAKTREEITKMGKNPDKAIVVRATVLLPYEMPEDYKQMNYFPPVLSPTIRASVTDSDTKKEYFAFAGLTDASVSTENQGDIDRSNLMYCPDITYHMQELLFRDDLDKATDADIWLLTIHTELVEDANGSTYDDSYYQSLLYASYYNSLYGGGYGYGGYGSYGYNSYSNYYNYMMLAQMMASANQTSYSYNTELDKDRYYKATLNGPTAGGKTPSFRVTFAVSKE